MGMAVAIAAILGTFAYLAYGGIGENLVYFLTPEELVARGDRAYDVPVRLGGQVVPGSVMWNAEAVDLRFNLTDGAKTVAVHSSGAPPQMFRDGIGVVVEGRYHREGVFESTSVMVKHSNEYRAPKHGEKPAEMYRSLTPGSDE
ncbi:MAG: cytochrome c maturation protein CcmE [Gemmatimonadaceae bacterium]